jgi:hypothetical protein
MTSLPDIVTHNYHPARGIGRNICDLPSDEAERILDSMRAMGRRLRPDYLRKRLLVEDWLIAAKSRKLGSTPLLRPLYFFLGNFADGMDCSRPESLIMPLAEFSPGCLTFTTSDSMTSYLIGVAEDGPGFQSHCAQVFTRAELEDMVATLGLPDDRWEGHGGEGRRPFIEMQVWDDQPIREWVKANRLSMRIN